VKAPIALAAASAIALAIAVCCTQAPKRKSEVVLPRRIWNDEDLATWATPVAGLGVRPSLVSEKDYYAAPVDDLRTYPVYHPNREPKGYREWMKSQGPQPIISPENLGTRADWIEAGRQVFEQLDTPGSRSSDPAVLAYFSDAAAIDAHVDAGHEAMTPEGVLYDYRWVVARDGTLQMSLASCQGCHTRRMPDGTFLPGAPSNFDVADSPATDVMTGNLRLSKSLSFGQEIYAASGVPWVEGDVHERFKTMSDEDVIGFMSQDSGEPPGTMFVRFNGSPFAKTRMADLRGIAHRKYLDATATHLHRGPEDLARYCILVEFADCATFGEHRMLPPDITAVPRRPSDEAVYAMALYLESLEVPESPYPFDEQVKLGQEIFEVEGCGECHTPPHYTSNKLVAAPGFEPPEDANSLGLDVSRRRVGTDPFLATKTRKGTGYYKIPSLRGVWYRGLYEHQGSVASLEDWFDPRRLSEDYVPTGFRGPGVGHRAVPGHTFGHDLAPDEKRALIAFLRTL